MSTDEKIASRKSQWLEKRRRSDSEWFDFLMSKWFESPIERLVASSLMVHCGYDTHPLGLYIDRERAERKIAESGISSGPNVPGCVALFLGAKILVPQGNVQIAHCRYRLDLAGLSAGERFAIEFDGHDFHERTKEQAQRDKSRDRALTLAGWRVLRFTGSEVYADPEKVASAIDDALEAPILRAWREHTERDRPGDSK